MRHAQEPEEDDWTNGDTIAGKYYDPMACFVRHKTQLRDQADLNVCWCSNSVKL